jgi:hypothetical protein
MLLQKLKINIKKIQERNDELIQNKWIDKLTTKQKKFINWRKGPPKILNRDGLLGYMDLSDYLINPDKFSEINVNVLRDYLSIYEVKQKFGIITFSDISDDLKKILKTIQEHRVHNIQKYIKIEDDIFKKGIYANDLIYRVQKDPFSGNIIKNSTSWSLAPIENFCRKEECHLYITRVPKDIKVLYLENNSKDKNLEMFKEFNSYEYEFVLPRDLEFKEYKTIKLTITNNNYASKNPNSNFINKMFIVHYIKIIKKIKSSEFPKIDNVKLICNI